MEVIDLPAEQEELYCQCLEEWSDEIKEAGSTKREWHSRMKPRGLRVKVAVDEKDTIGGMIQYGPIENVAIHGTNLYYVYCVWVHGYKKGRGNFQKKGMGKALLQAAEADARMLGAKGLIAWGVGLPVFMRASWFRKQGYQQIDSDGMMKLLWKPFSPDAVAPKWVKEKKKAPLVDGRVAVVALKNGWCPGQNIVYERAKRASAEFKDKVVFTEIDAFEREVGMAWGASDALFIDGKQIRTGPPPSYEKIRQLIARKAKKLTRKRAVAL
jgi:GNAT superfamily N-acetyltransferase